jgi:hypothetical protein
VGPRLKSDRERFSPNNILLMIAGGGLLWMGWAGFNGGAPYAANIAASVAVLNTNVSAATSLLTWTCLDVIFFSKPSVIGAVQGMMTGLVCITPGAGNSSLSLSRTPFPPPPPPLSVHPRKTSHSTGRSRVRRDDILLIGLHQSSGLLEHPAFACIMHFMPKIRFHFNVKRSERMRKN